MNPYDPPSRQTASAGRSNFNPKLQLLIGCAMVAAVPLIVLGSLTVLILFAI